MAGIRGFTLLEGLVVVSIIVLISAMVITNHSTYGSRVRLRNVQEEIATSFRQAQVYGSAVFGLSGAHNRVYGLHFDTVANEDSYILWSEPRTGGNRRYDVGEEIPNGDFRLPGGLTITSVVYGSGAAGDACTGAGVTPDPVVDFMFIRPSTDIELYDGNGTRRDENEYNYACIGITGPTGVTGNVKIYRTGYAHAE